MTNDCPKVAVYGAFDRFNYGDLLFPIILRRYLMAGGVDEGAIVPVAMRRSNLGKFGGVRTEPVGWMARPENLPDGSSVIVAGGEVLGAGWSQLHCHHMPRALGDFLLRNLSKRFEQRALDGFSQRRFGATWPIPFVVRPRYFENRVRTVFNAVGGTGLDALPEHWRSEVDDALGESALATVRDELTLGLANHAGEVASLAADSAGVVGDLFPREWLAERVSLATQRTMGRPGNYVCFQIHRYFGAKRLRLFAQQLAEFREVTGMRVVLLPIGRASGHSDQISLNVVGEAMPGDVELVEENGIWDIMALMANSRLVVASSLHAAITATSFEVPFLSFEKIPKCREFLKTWWDGEDVEMVDPPRMAEQMVAAVEQRGLGGAGRRLRESADAGLRAVVGAVLGG